VKAFDQAFSAEGWRSSRNSPYAGGYVTSLYGRPRENVHVLQIELNRSLYLDEAKVQRSEAFEDAKARIALAVAAALGTAQARSFAAE
jgi:N-formylglutamate amidohydrolase